VLRTLHKENLHKTYSEGVRCESVVLGEPAAAQPAAALGLGVAGRVRAPLG